MFRARFWSSRFFTARFWYATGADGVEATGVVSIPLTALRTLLAATTEFQTWVGAGSASEAEASIHLGGVPASSVTRPCAVISVARISAHRDALGARGWYLHEGALRVLFMDDIDDPTDYSAAETAFLGDLDTILRAALDLSGSGSYIALRSFALADDPTRSHEDDPEAIYEAPCEAVWGEP